MLYLVATPIGNLKDLSSRAVEVLSSSNYILCEDTRHSRILLDYYNIKTPLESYHRFSEAKKEQKVLEDLKAEKTISLISDAGTPGISDPGERLVRACVEKGLPATSVPGPCALLHALVCSGFPTAPFQFLGFLPKKTGEMTDLVADLFLYRGTTVCYESPKRIAKTLELLSKALPERRMAVARELTKKHEELLFGTAPQLLECVNQGIKGEIVLLISPPEKLDPWAGLSLSGHADEIQKQFNTSRNDAIKIVAKLRMIPRNAIYKEIHESDCR